MRVGNVWVDPSKVSFMAVNDGSEGWKNLDIIVDGQLYSISQSAHDVIAIAEHISLFMNREQFRLPESKQKERDKTERELQSLIAEDCKRKIKARSARP